MGLDSKSEVTLHSAIACTGICFPPLFREVILKSTVLCGDNSHGFPPIPEILTCTCTCTSSRFRFRPSCCVKRLVMSNIDESESSSALACMVDSFGPSIWTLHNISRTCLCCTVHDTLAVTMSNDSPECKPALDYLWSSLLESMCNHECCDWWHFLHLWPDGHSLMKYPLPKQFKHDFLSLITPILHLCKSASNILQV